MENSNISYFRKSDNFTFDSYRPHVQSDRQDSIKDENINNSNIYSPSNRANWNNTHNERNIKFHLLDDTLGVHISSIDNPFVPIQTVIQCKRAISHVTFNITMIGNPKLLLPFILSLSNETIYEDVNLIEFIMVQRGKKFKVLIFLLPLYTEASKLKRVVVNSHCVHFIGNDTFNSFNEIKTLYEQIESIVHHSFNRLLKYYIMNQSGNITDKECIKSSEEWAANRSINFFSYDLSSDPRAKALKILESCINALHQRRLNTLIKTFDRNSLRSNPFKNTKRLIYILGDYQLNRIIYEKICDNSTSKDYFSNNIKYNITFEEVLAVNDDRMLFYQKINSADGFIVPFWANPNEEQIKLTIEIIETVNKLRDSGKKDSRLPLPMIAVQCTQNEGTLHFDIPNQLNEYLTKNNIELFTIGHGLTSSGDIAFHSLMQLVFNNTEGIVTKQREPIKRVETLPIRIIPNPQKKDQPTNTRKFSLKNINEIVNSMKSPHSGISGPERKESKKSSERIFTGKEAIDWLMKYKSEDIVDRQSSRVVMQKLLELSIIKPISNDKSKKNNFEDSDNVFYTFKDENNPILNLKSLWIDDIANSQETVENILSWILEKIPSHIIKKENEFTLEYERVVASSFYEEMNHLVSQLQTVTIPSSNNNKKLAFWINVYNILSIHAHIQHHKIPKLKNKRKIINEKSFYYIGDDIFSLDIILNGIIKGKKKKYKSYDKISIPASNNFDWRIYFALTTMTTNGPRITVLKEDKLDSQLETCAKDYLNEHLEIQFKQNTILFPFIISLYKSDFGKDLKSILTTFSKYVDEEKEKMINYLLPNIKDKDIKIKCDVGNPGAPRILV